MKRELKVGTLSDLIRGGQLLRLLCLKCDHTSDLDPLDLLAKYGPVRVQSVLQHGYCAGCGARWPDLDCQTPPNLKPGSGIARDE